MTGTRTPTVAPKAMAGNPAVAEADRENKYIGDADHLLGARAARQAQILKFKKEQGQHGLVSLDAAIEWLEECNKELLTERIGKMWKALSGDVSIFKIGGDLLPFATIVQEDSSPPVSEFNALDLAAIARTKMYNDPRALRILIERLWVTRDVLLKLFQQKNWPLPPWLTAPEVTWEKTLIAPTSKNKSGAGKTKRSIQKAFNLLFPSGMPDEMSSQDRDDLIFGKLKELGFRGRPQVRTIQRAIKDLK